MKKEKPDKAYTPTEVGTLLEDIKKNIKLIAEGHTGLDKRFENVEVAVQGNTQRLELFRNRFSNWQ